MSRVVDQKWRLFMDQALLKIGESAHLAYRIGGNLQQQCLSFCPLANSIAGPFSAIWRLGQDGRIEEM